MIFCSVQCSFLSFYACARLSAEISGLQKEKMKVAKRASGWLARTSTPVILPPCAPLEKLRLIPARQICSCSPLHRRLLCCCLSWSFACAPPTFDFSLGHVPTSDHDDHHGRPVDRLDDHNSTPRGASTSHCLPGSQVGHPRNRQSALRSPSLACSGRAQAYSDLRAPPSSFALPQACIAQFVDVYSASAVVLGIPDISSDLSMGATGTCL